MKITKSQLKQLIKEELEALNERKPAQDERSADEIVDAINRRVPVLTLIRGLQKRVAELEMKIRLLEYRATKAS